VNVYAHGLESHSKSCVKKEKECLEDKEFADIVQKAKKQGECSNQLSFNGALNR